MIYLTNLTTRDEAMINLYKYKEKLSKQQFYSLKGQIKAGCYDEAMKGLNRLLKRINK